MLKLTFDGTKFRDDQGREVVNPEEIMEGLAIIKTDGKIEWPYGYEVIKKLNGATIHPRYIESIKLIPPSESTNRLTLKEGTELVDIYKKAGWHEDEANKTDMKDFKKFTVLEETPTTVTDSTEPKPESKCPTCGLSPVWTNRSEEFDRFVPCGPKEKNNRRERLQSLSDKIKESKATNEPKPELTKTLEEKREDMSRETWIKNVIRIEGYSRQEAENAYNRIILKEPTKEEPHLWYFKKYCMTHGLTQDSELAFKLGFLEGDWHGYKYAVSSQPSPSEELTKEPDVTLGEINGVRMVRVDGEMYLHEDQCLTPVGLSNLQGKLAASESRVKELEALMKELVDVFEFVQGQLSIHSCGIPITTSTEKVKEVLEKSKAQLK